MRSRRFPSSLAIVSLLTGLGALLKLLLRSRFDAQGIVVLLFNRRPLVDTFAAEVRPGLASNERGNVPGLTDDPTGQRLIGNDAEVEVSNTHRRVDQMSSGQTKLVIPEQARGIHLRPGISNRWKASS